MEVLKTLEPESVNCCVTSPPYWGLRNYGVDGQIGLEENLEEYIDRLVFVFREVRRVLRNDGTLWLNIGDTYCSTAPGTMRDELKPFHISSAAKKPRITVRPRIPQGLKPKDLIGLPWRLAFALQADGWYLRQDIIWNKTNCIPESVRDRCTKSHEYIFLLSKSQKYYFNQESILEPCVSDKGNAKTFRGGGAYIQGQSFSNSTAVSRESHGNKPNVRYGGKKYTENPEEFYRTKSGNMYDPRPLKNKRSVWNVSTSGYKKAHFATFPAKLIEPCILAGCPDGGTVLDPFFGSGTTGEVAAGQRKKYIGIELNDKYCELSRKRLGE